jgi:hypothetical protein
MPNTCKQRTAFSSDQQNFSLSLRFYQPPFSARLQLIRPGPSGRKACVAPQGVAPAGRPGYVARLSQTAGISLTARDAMLGNIERGSMTRAQVLREIIGSAELAQRVDESASVTMLYFGYLRREPRAGDINRLPEFMNKEPQAYRKQELRPDLVFTITNESGHPMAELAGQKVELFPQSESTFFIEQFYGQATFARDENGEVTHLSWRERNQAHAQRELKAKKMK